VYRSVGHIYTQVIDDSTGTTLASASSVDKETKKRPEGWRQRRVGKSDR